MGQRVSTSAVKEAAPSAGGGGEGEGDGGDKRRGARDEHERGRIVSVGELPGAGGTQGGACGVSGG